MFNQLQSRFARHFTYLLHRITRDRKAVGCLEKFPSHSSANQKGRGGGRGLRRYLLLQGWQCGADDLSGPGGEALPGRFAVVLLATQIQQHPNHRPLECLEGSVWKAHRQDDEFMDWTDGFPSARSPEWSVFNGSSGVETELVSGRWIQGNRWWRKGVVLPRDCGHGQRWGSSLILGAKDWESGLCKFGRSFLHESELWTACACASTLPWASFQAIGAESQGHSSWGSNWTSVRYLCHLQGRQCGSRISRGAFVWLQRGVKSQRVVRAFGLFGRTGEDHSSRLGRWDRRSLPGPLIVFFSEISWMWRNMLQ